MTVWDFLWLVGGVWAFIIILSKQLEYKEVSWIDFFGSFIVGMILSWGVVLFDFTRRDK